MGRQSAIIEKSYPGVLTFLNSMLNNNQLWIELLNISEKENIPERFKELSTNCEIA